MFGSVGGPEIILIFIVALIVFGPHQLPEIGRKVGGLLREFRKATTDFRSNVEREIGFDPITGLELTRKARRDILSTVSDPIRDVAEGAVGTLRQAKTETGEILGALKGAGTLPVSGRPSTPATSPAAADPASQGPPAMPVTPTPTSTLSPPRPSEGPGSRPSDPDPVPGEEGPKG